MTPQPRWRTALRTIGQTSARTWQRLLCGAANLRRRLLRQRLPDYVVITLNDALNERPPQQPWWRTVIPGQQPALSLADLSDALRRVAGDPALRGIILLYKGATLSLAQAQSLAALCERFRTWEAQYRRADASPKRIIAHLEQISRPLYVAACAADQIVVTPQTTWDVLGFHSAPTFWKTTLAQVGIEVDVVKVAPWKTAFDPFHLATMTPEYAAQTQWLLDSLYDDLVTAISQGRKLPNETVRGLIDGAPWNADQARAHGLIDAIAYEDELPAWLGRAEQPATLKPYGKVRGLLMRHPQSRPPQAVGVISLTGAIVPGQSRSYPVPLPLVGDDLLGHLTAQQQIRAARKNDSLGAVIVHVDSRGGSALASDLIWREIQLLNEEKPVIVYMGDVAASGGYYIALPSRQIVAQRATLTGSIGVIIAKPVLRETYAKIGAQRYHLQRGANADLLSEDRPWEGDQRQKIIDSIVESYHQFKTRVADGRNLPYEGLDALCNGRVWTGAQALANGLVDAVGDFHVAVERACTAAALPTDGSTAVIDLPPPKGRLLAEPVEAAKTALGLTHADELGHLARLLFGGEWQRLLTADRHWWLADDLPRFE